MEREENKGWVGEEEYVTEPVRGMDKMKRQWKGGQRGGQQTERKQEEAAKTVDVVLSSSFCRLVLSPTPKYTITSHWAWETSPNQHTASECLAYLFYCWLQRYSSLAEHHSSTTTHSLCLHRQENITMQRAQSGFWRNVITVQEL